MPRPGEIGIRVTSTTRVQARVPARAHVQVHGQAQVQTQTQTHVHTQAQAQGQVQVEVQAPPPPPPPPPPEPEVVVAIQGAPVVEFFGIPLEGAQDVVFVLDCSGSMANPAGGRLAQIQLPSSPPPTAAPSPEGQPGAPPPPEGQPGAPPPPDSPPRPDSQPRPDSPPLSPDTPPAGAPPVEPAVVTPRKIDVAQAELVDALQRLPAGTRMNVIFFNDELEGYAPTLVPLDEQGRATLIGFVRETAPTGNTALAPAMRTAFLMNPRRIVLLSDGLGNVGGGPDALLRDAREAIRGGVRIDTIGIGRGQDADLLQSLARESGGLYQRL